MRLTTLLISVFLVVGFILGGCGVPQKQYDADMAKVRAESDKALEELGQAQEDLLKLSGDKKMLEETLARLNAELAMLAVERDRNAKAVAQAEKRIATFRKMLERFQSMVQSGKLKIKIVNNKMVVEMASAILFPSGKAKLSREGRGALAQVAGVLAEIKERSFQVAGHTDNVPIRNNRFKSNWSLSSARAVAVVKHLIENGVPSTNLSAAGYGDTQPVASNDTKEGRAQNRRIEIVLQPNLDELPDLSALENMI
jgi:chemotaxis protein MotB